MRRRSAIDGRLAAGQVPTDRPVGGAQQVGSGAAGVGVPVVDRRPGHRIAPVFGEAVERFADERGGRRFGQPVGQTSRVVVASSRTTSVSTNSYARCTGETQTRKRWRSGTGRSGWTYSTATIEFPGGVCMPSAAASSSANAATRPWSTPMATLAACGDNLRAEHNQCLVPITGLDSRGLSTTHGGATRRLSPSVWQLAEWRCS